VNTSSDRRTYLAVRSKKVQAFQGVECDVERRRRLWAVPVVMTNSVFRYPGRCLMPGSSSLVPILRDTVPGRECDILQGPKVCFATWHMRSLKPRPACYCSSVEVCKAT